jgi:PAS domain S-box-containing protein
MTESVVESSTKTVSNVAKTEKIRVLHVDDDLAFLKIAKQCLELQGEIDVDTASSVNEALGKLKEMDYDVVVSDYQMPEKDGLEFLKELRANGNTVPFIVFTGKGREEIAVKALNLGADRYVDKHGGPEAVYCELAHALRQAVDRKSKQIEALKREAKLNAILESSPEAITVTDLDENIVECNRAAVDMHGGQSKEDLIGKNSLELIAKKDHKRVMQSLKKVIEQGSVKNIEYTFVTKDGREFPAELSASVVRDASGKTEYLVAITKNITERKKAEEALRKSEEKWRSLAENAPNIIMIVDRLGTIQFINRTVIDARPEEIVGKSIYDFIGPEHHNVVKKTIEQVFQTGEGRSYEISGAGPKGSVSWYETQVGPVRLDGKVASVTLITTDITERKKADQTLHASLDRYRSFIEVTGELGWTTSADGEIVEDLPSFREFTGLTYEEIKGWGWSKALHPDDLERTTRIWKEAVRTKSKYEGEYRLRRHDGVYRYFIARSVPVLNEDGSIREWVGTCIDITERKKAEEKLKESEKKFKLIFEGARDGILAVDVKTEKFVFANPRICEMTGYSEKELLRLGVEDIHPKKDLSYVIDAFTKMLQRKIEIGRDMPVLRKDRNVIYCDINSYPLEVGEKKLLVGLFRDVTERKNAEKVIMESQQRFEALFRNNPEAAVYLDLDFRILDMNARFCQLFGYSAKEVEGKQINGVVTPEDMIEEAERLDKDAKKGYASLDTVRKRKDGSLVHVSISAAPVTIEGKLLSYVEVYKDITDMKDTEERLKEMNKRLEATNEKLHVVGGLTRHGVRNKLSAVTGNAYLLRRKLTEDPKALEQLNDMEAAVRKVEQIFEFATNYEKLGVEKLAYMNVGKTADEAVSLFSGLKDVRILNECDGLTVFADSLLRQLFFNLVDNSLKYGEKTRQIKIYYNTLSADQLELIYEDDGIGIRDNMRSNLFKEGFTSGKGSGYGLFMIKRICEVYGWTIRETGKQGKGAQFTMSIPRISSTGKAKYQIQKPRQHEKEPETNMEVPNALSPTEQSRGQSHRQTQQPTL